MNHKMVFENIDEKNIYDIDINQVHEYLFNNNILYRTLFNAVSNRLNIELNEIEKMVLSIDCRKMFNEIDNEYKNIFLLFGKYEYMKDFGFKFYEIADTIHYIIHFFTKTIYYNLSNGNEMYFVN